MTIRENDDIRALFYHEGRLILQTKRSKGRGIIPGKIPQFMRQQMKLNEDEFAELMACPLGLPEYVEILRQKGLLPQPPPAPPAPPGRQR
jgi:hypothetical protein